MDGVARGSRASRRGQRADAGCRGPARRAVDAHWFVVVSSGMKSCAAPQSLHTVELCPCLLTIGKYIARGLQSYEQRFYAQPIFIGFGRATLPSPAAPTKLNRARYG